MSVDVMFCVALLELKRRAQSKQLTQQSKNDVEKYRCELVTEAGDDDRAVNGDGAVSGEQTGGDDVEEQRSGRAKESTDAETDNARDDVDREELKITDDVTDDVTGDVISDVNDDVTEGVVEIRASTEKTVGDVDAASRLRELERTEKLDDDLGEVEPRERESNDTSSAVISQTTDAADKQTEADDIDVIDLSYTTPHCTSVASSQHVTVCFEVCPTLSSSCFCNITAFMCRL